MGCDTPMMLPIKEVIEEARGIKSFIFEHPLHAKPGQFVMLWLPGMDAKPMSVSADNGRTFTVTLSGVGPFSNKMMEMHAGDSVGVMGPFGTHFSMDGKNVAMVGGGYGSGPLTLLAEERKKAGKDSHLIIGARTADLLLFRGRTSKAGITTYYATNDGSFGFHGLSTELLEKVIRENNIDRVMTCGPELMMKKILEICQTHNIPCELSIERYMKCGIGICGTCCVDPLGIRTCVEGPVVSGEVAQQITEFGKYHRDRCGVKHPFEIK